MTESLGRRKIKARIENLVAKIRGMDPVRRAVLAGASLALITSILGAFTAMFADFSGLGENSLGTLNQQREFGLHRARPSEASEGYVSRAELEYASRLDMLNEGVQAEERFKFASRKSRTKKGPPRPTAAPQRPQTRRQREVEFIANNKALMDREIAKFDRLKRRYYKQHPVVKEIDEAFGRKNMPRFMALYDEYHKSDPFQLWRKAFMLPEFRKGVRRYATDPRALKVGARFIADYLSQKPSLKVLHEGLLFAATDQSTANHLRKDFWPQVIPNLPGALRATSVPKVRQEAMTSIATLISGPEERQSNRGAPGVNWEWKGKNTREMDGNMNKSLSHGIDFYLMQQSSAKAVAETEKTDYHGKLKKQK